MFQRRTHSHLAPFLLVLRLFLSAIKPSSTTAVRSRKTAPFILRNPGKIELARVYPRKKEPACGLMGVKQRAIQPLSSISKPSKSYKKPRQ